jgi:decaprenylphospho-beta-D-ribofuranose 2-oxidase
VASWSNVRATVTEILPYGTSGIDGIRLPFIPRGAGCSFGDAAFVTNGTSLTSSDCYGIGELNAERGVLKCESGVTLGALHAFLEKQGLSFPVYGGTRLATVGGAVASDIHGKNDVHEGSFGNHIESIRLLTADGEEKFCSGEVCPDLFSATIGGMGLTGFIRQVALRLGRQQCRAVKVLSSPIADLDDAIRRLQESKSAFQFCSFLHLHAYSFWGVHFAAFRITDETGPRRRPRRLWLPLASVSNGSIIQALSRVVLTLNANANRKMHVMDFNYIGIHDRFTNWRQLYNRNGFLEYHAVVPANGIREWFSRLMRLAEEKKIVLHFGIIKQLGSARRKGLLSFPREGFTVNFQVKDCEPNRKFLINLTDFLIELKGRVYLAKDAYLLPRQLLRMYDRLDEWQEITRQYDPYCRIQSDLSRRLGLKQWH